MSDDVLQAWIGWLITRLEQAGHSVDGQDGLWPEQIADMIWLAGQMPRSVEPESTKSARRTKTEERADTPRSAATPKTDDDTVPDDAAAASPSPMASGQTDQRSPEPQITLDPPAGPAPQRSVLRRLGGPAQVQDSRDALNYYSYPVRHTQPVTLLLSRPVRQRAMLSRSMRPLLRRIPSRTASSIDIAATVEQIAVSRAPMVVLRPARERRYDLALVIDAQARSLSLWHDWIADFCQFISSQGAFRQITIWSIHDDAQAKLNQGRPYLSVGLPEPTGDPARAPQPRRQVNEVLDPTQRRLIMVVSNFVGAAWQPARLPVTLASWGRQNLVTLLQLLPERLWEQTQLRHRRSATAYQPLSRSRDLAILPETDLETEVPHLSRLVPMPVTTALAPQQVAAWARTLIGLATHPIRVALFDPEPPQAEHPNGKASARPALSPEAQQRQQAERWLERATITSRRLAKRLALAGPLELPMMRLIQQRLPGSDEGHLADLFLRQLIEPVAGGNGRPLYSFPAPIAELITNDHTGEDGRFRVAVDIAEYYGIDVRAFLEYGQLPDLRDDQGRRDGVLPFLSILKEELSQYGTIFERHTSAIQQLEIEECRRRGMPALLIWLQRKINAPKTTADMREQLRIELNTALGQAAAQLQQRAQTQIDAVAAQRAQAIDTLDPAPLTSLIATYRQIVQRLEQADLLELEPSAPATEAPAQGLRPETAQIIAQLRSSQALTEAIARYRAAITELLALETQVAHLAAQLASADAAITDGDDQRADGLLHEIQQTLGQERSARVEQALALLAILREADAAAARGARSQAEAQYQDVIARAELPALRARAEAGLSQITAEPPPEPDKPPPPADSKARQLQHVQALANEAESYLLAKSDAGLKQAERIYDLILGFGVVTGNLRQSYEMRRNQIVQQRQAYRAGHNELLTALQLAQVADTMIALRKLIAAGETVGPNGEDLSQTLADTRAGFVAELLRVAEEEAHQASTARRAGLDFLDARQFAMALEHYIRAVDRLDKPEIKPDSPQLISSDPDIKAAISYLRDEICKRAEVVAAAAQHRRELEQTMRLNKQFDQISRRYQEAEQALATGKFDQAHNLFKLIATMLEPDTSAQIAQMIDLAEERIRVQAQIQSQQLLAQAHYRFASGDLDGARHTIQPLLSTQLSDPVTSALRAEAQNLSTQIERDRHDLVEIQTAAYHTITHLAGYSTIFAGIDALLQRQPQHTELRRIAHEMLRKAVGLAFVEVDSTVVSSDRAALQALQPHLAQLVARFAAQAEESPTSVRRLKLEAALARVQATLGSEEEQKPHR